MRFGQYHNDTSAYEQARAELLRAEMALRDQCEKVAALRRNLPEGAPVDNYVFQEGPRDLAADGPTKIVKLSELFVDPDKSLIVYQFMYGGAQKDPCPMCSLCMDGFNGISRHLDEVGNVALIAAAPVADMRAWARDRRWHGLRIASCGDTTFKRDFNFETPDGGQLPGVSVFRLNSDGTVRHTYSASAIMGEGEYRGLDLLNPLWNVLDLTTEGRSDFMPKAQYD